MMRFGSVCSGIEAASVAWHPLGWQAAWLAEIEPFPSAVLKHHYPAVPNLGDMTQLPDRIRSGEVEAPDLFCGGTPCQAFSVAGLRKSLDDARGNLSLTFCEIANAIDVVRLRAEKPAAVIFWENVPGVLSTQDNAFGCFLAGLAGEDDPIQPPGKKWSNAGVVLGPQRAVAWRVLDAQYFGVAQRRRRVFVVASSREGFDPAAVLFEFDGMRRDTAPSREAGKAVATLTAPRSGGGGSYRPDAHDVDGGFVQPVVGTIGCNTGPNGHGFGDFLNNQAVDAGHIVTHSLRGEGFDASEDGTGRGTPLVPVGFNARQDPDHWQDRTGPLDTDGSTQAVAFTSEQTPKFNADCALTLTKQSPTGGGQPQAVMTAMQVRRLTPVECERLQGFPDNYTAIPWRGKPADQCPDGPRYKALGNSWAVPVVRWIGERIALANSPVDVRPIC